MSSCTSVVGLSLTIVVFVAATLSYSMPFWIEGTGFNAGLWEECYSYNCSFISLNQTDLPEWFNPLRIVFGVAVASDLLVILMALFYLVFSCCMYSIRAIQFIILVLFFGGLEMTASVVTYAIKFNDTSYLSFDVPDDVHFGWSFYLAAASVIGFIVSVISFVLETSSVRGRQGYEPIKPTTYA